MVLNDLECLTRISRSWRFWSRVSENGAS